MAKERIACPQCASTNQKDFHCAPCIQSEVFDKAGQRLQHGKHRKELISKQLNGLLEIKNKIREQRSKQQQHVQRMKALNARISAAKLKLEQAQKAREELATTNANRRKQLEHAQSQLALTRSDVLSNTFPTLVRYQSLTLSHVQATVLTEARQKLLDLLNILPVAYHVAKSGSGPPNQVTILNAELPDTPSTVTTMQTSTEELNAALGYLLLFMELMAQYVGGPLLHDGRYQGSTSKIWQPESFWRQPVPNPAMLPLHTPTSSSSPISNLSSRVTQSTTSLWTFPSMLMRSQTPQDPSAALHRQSSDPIPDHHSAPDPCTPQPPARTSRLEPRAAAELKAGYEALSRSMACFVQAKAHELKVQLPPGWGPLGWLVLLCSFIRQEFPDATGGPGLGASILQQAAHGQASGIYNNGYMLANDYDPDDDDDEGWDMIKTPRPPPPSQPDEVEHWTRAMFTDARDLNQPQPLPPAAQVQQSVKALIAGRLP